MLSFLAKFLDMGQSTSSQREHYDLLHRDRRRFSQLVHDRESRSIPQQRTQRPREDHINQPPTTPLRRESQQDLQSFATFSRQISARSIPARGTIANHGNTPGSDEIFYEQQEIRPLVHMEELGMRNAPITYITASPMPRRNSVVSRISSRLLPRYITANYILDDQERYGEGRAIRWRLSDTHFQNPRRNSESIENRRFSMLGPLTSPSSRRRRHREIASISIPRPRSLGEDGPLSSPDFTASSLQSSPVEEPGPHIQLNSASEGMSSTIHDSRFSRIYRSLSVSMESMFLSSRNNAPQELQRSPQRPLTGTIMENSEQILPMIHNPDPVVASNASYSESSLPTHSEHRMQGLPAITASTEHPSMWTESPTWTEHWADHESSGRREGRRIQNMQRGRSSRLTRHDDNGPLPTILHLAATAIAAQHSGTSEHAITDMQTSGADGLDSILNALFRTLQHTTASTRNERPPEEASDPNRPRGTFAPLDSLRVFRFVNQNPSIASVPRSSDEDSSGQATIINNVTETPDGRTVTLVVVGVRSAPSENIERGNTPATEPSLDALLSLLVNPSTNVSINRATGMLRQVNGRSRFSPRRRASIGGIAAFPANYEGQRHQRFPPSSGRSSIDASPSDSSAIPLNLSESSVGPSPPPSTPADSGLSAYFSGAAAQYSRPSSALAVPHSHLLGRDVATQHLHEAGILTAEDHATQAVQQRRRSDTEFARHRDLGAGAARRNGVVEPDDDVEPGDLPSPGSRSWLIYVVGTNLSENHTAFATPSLFTDVSIFESLLLTYGLSGDLVESQLRRYVIIVIASRSGKTTGSQPGGCSLSSRSSSHKTIQKYASSSSSGRQLSYLYNSW